jgi:competence protein ComEA
VAVPSKNDHATGSASGPGTASTTGSRATATGASGGGAGSPGLVNINTADATKLDSLPGVGPSTAAKIIADRERSGPFASPDDLGRVSGIGPKRLDQLKPLITTR